MDYKEGVRLTLPSSEPEQISESLKGFLQLRQCLHRKWEPWEAPVSIQHHSRMTSK